MSLAVGAVEETPSGFGLSAHAGGETALPGFLTGARPERIAEPILHDPLLCPAPPEPHPAIPVRGQGQVPCLTTRQQPTIVHLQPLVTCRSVGVVAAFWWAAEARPTQPGSPWATLSSTALFREPGAGPDCRRDSVRYMAVAKSSLVPVSLQSLGARRYRLRAMIAPEFRPIV